MKNLHITLILLFCSHIARAQEPVLVKDIVPGSDDALFFASDIAFILDSLYIFQADTDNEGEDLWRSDGSESGTYLLKEIKPGTGLNEQRHVITFNHIAYFYSNDDNSGNSSIWRTDGTPEGTYKFYDPCNIYSRSTAAYGALGDRMIFAGVQPNGDYELMITNGDTANIALLKKIGNGSEGRPSNFRNFKDKLYFSANGWLNNREIWRTDGTPEGTEMLLDLNGTGILGSEPSLLIKNDDYLFFTAVNSDTMGREMWRTDGTPEGTVMVKDIYPGPGSGAGGDYFFTVFMGDRLLFPADDGVNGRGWWISDGTDNGTYMFKQFDPVASGNTYQGAPLMTNDSFAIIHAYDADYGYELWRTDGTDAGTYLLKDIKPGTESGMASGIVGHKVTTYKNKLYFVATDPVYDEEIWVSDGTPDGTYRLTDMHYNFGQSPKRNLKVINGWLFFYGAKTGVGHELWKLWIDETSDAASPAAFETNIAIFPNPASDAITYSIQTREASAIRVALTDQQGRVIRTSDEEKLSARLTVRQMPVNDLPPGMYFLTFYTDSGIQTRPVTIRR